MMRVARDSRGNYFPMLVELTGRSLGASSNPCQLGKLFWDVIGVVEPIVLQSLEENVFAVPWSRTRNFCLVQCEESVMVCGRGSALSRYRIRGQAIGSTSLQPLCSANLRYPISVMFTQCDNRAIRTPRYVALFFMAKPAVGTFALSILTTSDKPTPSPCQKDRILVSHLLNVPGLEHDRGFTNLRR